MINGVTSKMKLLYHHRTRGDGAEGVHIQEMITAFGELGHTVSTCCPRSSKRPPGAMLGMTGMSLADSRGWIGSLKLGLRQALELGYNLLSFARLVVTIGRFRPDLVYERYSCYHFAGVLAAKLCRVPMILEVNSTYAGRFRRRKLAFYWACRLIENYALRNVAVVAVVSRPLRDCVMDRITGSTSVVVTPNAVNEQAVRSYHVDQMASRARLKIDADDVVIGFVGSLRKWHGIDILARVIPQVVEQIPRATFLVVGAGELEEQLRELELSPQLRGKLLLTGGVPHAETYDLIAAMDIGLMPHSNEWGSPMKILEYMSLGKLCIAPRIGPIEEIVEDGITGVLFSPGDDQAFLQAILDACKKAQLRREIGERARDFVLNHRRWVDNANIVLSTFSATKRTQ